MKYALLPLILVFSACGGDSSETPDDPGNGAKLPPVSDKPDEAAIQQLQRFDEIKSSLSINTKVARISLIRSSY